MTALDLDEVGAETIREDTSRRRAPGRQQLMVMAGPDRGLSRALDREEITVGKRRDADLPLTDPTVSRQHCVVVATPFGPLIRDLGSRNGVRIDGNWIQAAYLRKGALVRLGETALVLESNEHLDETVEARELRLGATLGHSPAMHRIFEIVPRIANSDASVLIEGETGTGQDVARRCDSPSRAHGHGGPFIVIDCGAIPATLIESELFGHERGSFTGAPRRARAPSKPRWAARCCSMRWASYLSTCSRSCSAPSSSA